ncbi:hypothetical protein [Paenibacillus sp. HB172176]|uniref:hypothetical protein n=1 Tax=Paenibacillus sp. HB172176 TaxID=2493690 RepID=UPI00143918FC|nr:hypothetical protein [Paenibacillus sp. HB172176]
MTSTNDSRAPQPRLGIQGSVLAWQDPWAGQASDQLMRTGTGRIVLSQDDAPRGQEFMKALRELHADFYVHHVFPGFEGQRELLADACQYGIDLCLGNEYGNINGPWVEGTNRYDIPDAELLEAAASGRLIGILYDEPEHLQINAAQYRKDGWFPHWKNGDGAASSSSSEQPLNAQARLDHARECVTKSVETRVKHVQALLANAHSDSAAHAGVPGAAASSVPLLSEQVFPVLFHAQARGGMAPCPKIMKESFQSLQLATALGAAKQYGRPMWICADLWGPDVGSWFTRTPGFPGHSPEEFASALRMGYYMGPSHLFAENADVLLSYGADGFRNTEFGDVWQQFTREFIPANPLRWTHQDAAATIALIHSDDSNYGQNERPFGSRELSMPAESQSVFRIWHMLSHGAIPAHGNNMHIPGFDFPRHELKRQYAAERFPLRSGAVLPDKPNVHPLFYPTNNVLVYDGFVQEHQLGSPNLIIVAGTSVSSGTLLAVRKHAEEGAAVIAAEWLLPAEWRSSKRYASGGLWLPVSDFLSDAVREACAPHLGRPDCWTQRFGASEIRMYKKDADGFTLDFESIL